MGLSKLLIILLSLYGCMSFKLSSRVFPVTVMHSPFSSPFSNNNFIKGCMPPEEFNSDI